MFRTLKPAVHDLCTLLSDFEFTLSTLVAQRDKSVKSRIQQASHLSLCVCAYIRM